MYFYYTIMESSIYIYVFLVTSSCLCSVKGDCLDNGKQCLRNVDCCSGNCTYDETQMYSYYCQPEDVVAKNDKTDLLDFSSLRELGLQNVQEAEIKAEEVKNTIFTTKSKLNDLSRSLASLAKVSLKEELSKLVEIISEKLNQAKTDAKYNAECLERLRNTLSDDVNEASEAGVKCAFYSSSSATKLITEMAELDVNLKTGLAKTGGKVLLECSKNSLLFSGSTVKDCGQTAVDGILNYLVNIDAQVQEIFNTSENLVFNLKYCRDNSKALVEKSKDSVLDEIEKCKG